MIDPEMTNRYFACLQNRELGPDEFQAEVKIIRDEFNNTRDGEEMWSRDVVIPAMVRAFAKGRQEKAVSDGRGIIGGIDTIDDIKEWK